MVDAVWQVWTSTCHNGTDGCSCRMKTKKQLRDGEPDVEGTPACSVQGHSGGVNAVAFSADGKCVVSGSSDGLVKIWNAETGSEVCSFVEMLWGWRGDDCVVRRFRAFVALEVVSDQGAVAGMHAEGSPQANSLRVLVGFQNADAWRLADVRVVG
jgi:WD40 repeat protein